jgi:hypothetical protein
VLDRFLALDSKLDFLMSLYVNEPLESIPFRETFDHAFAVLPGATRNVRSDADI